MLVNLRCHIIISFIIKPYYHTIFRFLNGGWINAFILFQSQKIYFVFNSKSYKNFENSFVNKNSGKIRNLEDENQTLKFACNLL